MNQLITEHETLTQEPPVSTVEPPPSPPLPPQKPKKLGLFAQKPHVAAWIGTTLEYYDSALYWFMAPLLTPIFLPKLDPTYALIIAYATYPLGIFSRPLGAIIIGRIGDRRGRKHALTISIMGTAVVTGLVGCLPSYHAIGIAAPVLFMLSRMIQKFFVAGEYNGGAIFALEHATNNKGFKSGLYCAFTVIGIFAAAIVTTLVAYLPTGYWRLAYLLAFLTGIVGLYIRTRAPETPEFNKRPLPATINTLKGKISFYRYSLLISLGAAACFGTICTIHSSFTNAFIPMITHYSTATIMSLNNITLAIYMIALPLFGKLADHISIRKSMLLATIAIAILTYPLFLLLNTETITSILILKATFAILAAWFIGPFHAWIQQLYGVHSRYQMVSLSYSIGSQLGGSTPALGLFLWKITSNPQIPAFLIIFWALIGTLAVSLFRLPQDPLNSKP